MSRREKCFHANSYSIKPLLRAQEAALKVLESTPNLAKELPSDSILRINTNQLFPQAPRLQLPYTPEHSSESHWRPGSLSPQSSQKQILNHMECNKKYSELETKYKAIEKEFYLFKSDQKTKEQRFIKREEEFRKIIHELEQRLRTNPTGEEPEKLKEINDLHNNILQKIDTFQSRASNMLIDQEKYMARFFDTKVEEIRQAYEDEKIKFRENHKKFTEKEKQLIAEMEWIKEIAQKIDHQNQIIGKKYQDLKIYQATHNEEERLLKDVMSQKRKITVLECQIEQYEKIIEEFAKEKDIKRDSIEDSQEQSSGSKIILNPSDLSLNATMVDSANETSLNVSPVKHYGAVHRSFASTNCAQSNREPPFKYSDIKGDEGAVSKLKSILNRERKQKQQIKTAYVKEMEFKNEINEILKECIQDIKTSIAKMKKEKPVKKPKEQKFYEKDSVLSEEERNMIIEKLVTDQRILEMIYDKAFSNKKIPLGKASEIFIETDDDYDF